MILSKSEELDLLRRTHQIWVGISRKDIALVAANPPGRTDCETFISVPLEDPDVRLILPHEWSHVIFHSNLRARQAFIEAYSEQIRQRIPLDEEGLLGLEEFLHAFINGLDDLRVSSLWELIYPKSAEDIQNRWRRIIDTTKRYRRDIVLYTMGLGLGMRFTDDEPLEWRRYESVLLDTTVKVLRRGFLSCLIAARVAIDTIIDDVLKQRIGSRSFGLPPPLPLERLQTPGGPKLGASRINRPDGPPTDEKTARAQANTISKMIEAVHHRTREEARFRESWSFTDTDRIPAGQDPDCRNTQSMAQAALGVSNSDQVNYLLEQGHSEIQRILEALKGTAPRLSPDERITHGVEGKIIFRDVQPSMVANLPLQTQDLRAVQVLRQSFIKRMDKKSRARSESGSELDPGAYIDMLYGDGDPAIFREEASSKGFSALVLIDMSGSMRPKWASISRACKVLATAMRFPFSNFNVWGFSSDHEGRAHILRFQDPTRGYWGPGLKEIWGLTPLHLAAEVGVRYLQLLPGSTQHLFILTDGYPSHLGVQSGYMPTTSELMTEVMKKVQGGRRRGVNVAGLVIGYAVLDESADYMFGPGHWSRLSEVEDGLFQGMVGLVRHSFASFLGRR